MECQRISVEMAAEELNCRPAKVRQHMRYGIWDLGSFISKEKSGKQCDKFHVYREKLNKHIEKYGICKKEEG